MNVKLFKQNITKRDEEEQYIFIKEIICHDNVSISNIYFLNTRAPSFVKETTLQVISHVDINSGRCQYPTLTHGQANPTKSKQRDTKVTTC